MEQALQIWTAVLQRRDNPTSRLLKALGDAGGAAHLAKMLRRWSHGTVIRRGRNAVKFLDWAEHCHVARDVEPDLARPVQLVEYIDHLAQA